MKCVCFAVAALVAAMSVPTPAAGQKFLNVATRQADVRATPSPFGGILGTVSYGDRVQILEEKGAWTKVSAPAANLTGWLHSTALTRQPIKMLAGNTAAGTGASSGEMVLASKGFTQEVEGAYKDKNPTLNFTWVDRMEKYKASPEQIRSFAKDGGLKLEGGAK